MTKQHTYRQQTDVFYLFRPESCILYVGRSQNTLPARLADNSSISQNYGKKYVLSRVYHER